MPRPRRFPGHATATAFLLAACSSAPPPSSGAPGAVGAGSDGGHEPGIDAGSEAGTVVGPTGDASVDASGGGTGQDAGTPPAGDGGSAASTAKAKVLATLGGFTGHHVAIGVEDKDSSNPTADSDTMTSMAGTGEHPSFWSADWGFGSGAVSHRETIVQEGVKQWKKGAIVQYIYHACPPSWGADESCGWGDVDGSNIADTDWPDLVTPGGALYKVWIARLDVLAGFFQELKDAGVAPLFRVMHEMNDGWVWWAGHGGQSGSAALYRITHDYLVNVKGLDDIIWVWNLKDIASLPQDVAGYNPGSSYYDIAALDMYVQGYTAGNYAAMQQAAAGKPMGIAECEVLPDSGTLASQPLWSYVAMWPDYFNLDTTVIPQLFGDPRVVTLEKMPGW